MSSKSLLTVVDEEDNVINHLSWDKVHEEDGLLHRAVTVLLFNNCGELLMQKRSEQKRLWPSYLDLSVATHVFADESYESAARRRLREELGIDGVVDLEKLFVFRYHSQYRDVGSEREMCAVFRTNYDGKVSPNPEEISEYNFASIVELRSDVRKSSGNYTPWFLEVFKTYIEK